MTDELIVQIVANIPNFAGFAMMGFILWRIYQRQAEMLDKCLEKLE